MTEAEKEAREALIDDREALVNLIPLGFMERDPVRNVYEAADRILAAGFRRGAPAVTDEMVEVFTVAINRAGYVLYRDATRVGLRAALTTKEGRSP